MGRLQVVLEEAQLRSGPILDPDIEPPVVIPVDAGRSARVVDEIEPADPGRIDEVAVPRVEEGAVPLASTPRRAVADGCGQFGPALQVAAARTGSGIRQRRLRRDPPPEEASQIVLEFPAHESVGHQQVLL